MFQTHENSVVVYSALPEAKKRKASVKVAAFDLDSTLIKTKSGRKFAKDGDDWMWWHACIPEKVNQLRIDGYVIAILSNQYKMLEKADKEAAWKHKIPQIVQKLGNVVVLAATKEDQYRKPRAGMWQLLSEMLVDPIDTESSFYVGDAAGRDGDFSCSDRKFAANLGIPFHTPEALILEEKERPFEWGFDPKNVLSCGKETVTIPPNETGKTEMIILCGAPGIGKSTLCATRFPDYVRVNRDTLKTMAKCTKAAKQALKDGKSCVIDNTNPTVVARKTFCDIAKEAGVTVRCVVVQGPRELAQHMNVYRFMHCGGTRVPDVAYNMYYSKYEQPNAEEEGFESVYTVPFQAFFASDVDRAVFLQYLT